MSFPSSFIANISCASHLGRLTSFRRRSAHPKGRVSAPFHHSRRYHNLGLHMRMQTAEIFKRSCFIEGEAELVLGVERRRTKRAIQRNNRMHNVILVLPHHRGSDRDRDGIGLEGEVVDGGAGGGWYGSRSIGDATQRHA